MNISFDTHENEKQKQAIVQWNNDEKEIIVYGGAKGGAKSFTGGAVLCMDALMYPETHYYIARKRRSDLVKFTIPTIREVLKNMSVTQDYWIFKAQEFYIEFYNRSRIYFLEVKYMPSDPEYMRFGSMQFTRGFQEEVGEWETKSASTNLLAATGRWNNDKYGLKKKTLITCNPSKNFLYYDYYKPFKTNSLPKKVCFIQSFASDNKKLDKGYTESLLEDLTKAEIERLYYGNWEYDDDPSKLLSIEEINDFFDSNISTKDQTMYLTADIALQGSDKFVLGIWKGKTLIKVITIDKCTGKEAVDFISKTLKENSILNRNFVYDNDGVGQGLSGFFKNSRAFVNNSSPVKIKGKKQQYSNLATQCGYILCQDIRSGKYNCIDHTFREEITKELEQIKNHNFNTDEKIKIDKKKIKEILGYSPDFYDMLKMRVLFDIKNTSIKIHKA